MTLRPRFSLVAAVSDDAAVLPTFIDSVEAQHLDLAQVQVVLVEVDAPADVVAMLQYWATERPGLVTVLSAPGSSPVAALNAGLAAATGTWVGFPEVADSLAPGYLAAVATFLDENPATALVATQRLVAGAEHPLAALFRTDDLVDLTTSTRHFHDSAATAFFALDPVRDAGLAFDAGLPTSFAGTHFLGRYLIEVAHPAVGFVASAGYLVARPRPDRDSTAAARALFDRGYSDLVRRSLTRYEQVPAWLQRLLAYELATFVELAAEARPADLGPDDEMDAFHTRIAVLIRSAGLAPAIERAQFPVSRAARVTLVRGYTPSSWVDDHVHLDKLDHRAGLVRARYYFAGVAPTEEARAGGLRTEPVHQKTRTLTYVGRVPLRERILWLRAEPDLTLLLDGEAADLRFTRPDFATTTIEAAAIGAHLGTTPGRGAGLQPVPVTREGQRAQEAIAVPKTAREFADAWVFVDRVHAGGDNAEHLFTHLRAEHPRINAFFVVQEGTSSWARLRKAHGPRVVGYGSHQWRVLMAHCVQLISSHADEAILSPPELTDFMRPAWRFTFVGRGVMTGDDSRRLQDLPIDLMTATTGPEFDAMAGSGNDYPLTTKEVVLTGMARLDHQVAMDRATQPEDRRLLLVAPTWREWLVRSDPGSRRGEVAGDALESEYVARWLELLHDPELAELCVRHGLTLTLLIHPNLEPLLAQLPLPAYVAVAGYAENDPQALFAQARILVTDYSSVAFDAASIGRPVVYFQFDRDRYERETPGRRPGYFSYEDDGFGPVTTTTGNTLIAIAAIVESGLDLAPLYAERAALALPFRDGRNCERIVAELLREPT